MTYWNSWYSGWGWFLWVGVWFLLISSFGNWGYTYRAHRLYRDINPQKTAKDVIDERYAKGEIDRNQYVQMKKDLSEGSPKSEGSHPQFAPA
jgi:putative membrane protein